jgi:hypothetical protein
MSRIRKPGVVAAAAIVIGVSPLALAQVDQPRVTGASATHIAMLSGDNEVPAVTTNGNGTAFLLLDMQTNTLTWTIEYADMTGPATGAHIHGPAAAGENAEVVVDLGGEGLESPIEGQMALDQEQVDQLVAGNWYVNVHTEANPGGEIRGQIEANQD